MPEVRKLRLVVTLFYLGSSCDSQLDALIRYDVNGLCSPPIRTVLSATEWRMDDPLRLLRPLFNSSFFAIEKCIVIALRESHNDGRS